MIGGFGVKFYAEKEKRSVQNLRVAINNFKERVLALVDHSNESAVSEANHYIAALDAQLVQCDRTEDMINRLALPLR